MIVIVVRYLFFIYMFKECIISIPIRDKLIPIILYILHVIRCRHHGFCVSLVTVEVPLLLCIEVSLTCILLCKLRCTSQLTVHPLRECKLHYNIPIDCLLVRSKVWNKGITSFISSNCFISEFDESFLLVCNNPARFNKVLWFIFRIAAHEHSI